MGLLATRFKAAYAIIRAGARAATKNNPEAHEHRAALHPLPSGRREQDHRLNWQRLNAIRLRVWIYDNGMEEYSIIRRLARASNSDATWGDDQRDLILWTVFRNAVRLAAQAPRGLKEKNTPLVLTVNGRAELVVQDAESYQKLLDRLEEAESKAAIREGVEQIKRGEGIPWSGARKRLLKKHGF